MSLRFAVQLLTAALFALIGSLPAFAEGTTRIETRPFYGATVTLEEGVRVFRPLPADKNVIINPGGQAPLAIGINETNVYERRVIKNYNYNETSNSGGPRYFYGGGGYYNPYGYGYGRGHGGDHGGHKGGPGGLGARP